MTTIALDTRDLTAAAEQTRTEAAVREQLRATWRYLRMHGAAANEADDLTQESFVIAAQKNALELDAAATATFLRRTARFLFLRSRRGDRQAVLLADAVDELWQRDCATDGANGMLEALRHCLRKLSPRSSQAVRRAYGLDGDTPDNRTALAAELGLQENGIKTLMQRARQQLRECIDRRTDHDG